MAGASTWGDIFAVGICEIIRRLNSGREPVAEIGKVGWNPSALYINDGTGEVTYRPTPLVDCLPTWRVVVPHRRRFMIEIGRSIYPQIK